MNKLKWAGRIAWALTRIIVVIAAVIYSLDFAVLLMTQPSTLAFVAGLILVPSALIIGTSLFGAVMEDIIGWWHDDRAGNQ